MRWRRDGRWGDDGWRGMKEGREGIEERKEERSGKNKN
jgi:hypothetical protein